MTSENSILRPFLFEQDRGELKFSYSRVCRSQPFRLFTDFINGVGVTVVIDSIILSTVI